jgi:prepilin-type processing-associated H-X9-DG protein
MPIPYSCPHCGKQFSVAEQYAGQTGPCANCGKPITIPGKPPDYVPQAAAAAGVGGGLFVIALGVIGVLVVCGGILLALLLPAVQAAREAARRAQSSNNMKQILLAMHNYHDVYGTFPPAVVTDEAGKPLYSGRVLLLPFLEQMALYEEFDKTKAWDSQENWDVSQTSIRTFMDPSSPDQTPGKTDYVFVTGQGTVFEAGKTIRLTDLTDGTSNTMVLVEHRNTGISWAEPKDLDVSQPMALPPGNHPNGNIVGFADGSVRVISKTVSPTLIREMATRSGQEAILPP